MSESPRIQSGARATLVLAIVSMLFGLGGVTSAYGALETGQSAITDVGPTATVEEAAAAMERQKLATPIARGLAVANLLASVLLVIAGLLLTLRRPTALWWTAQALFANILYTIAKTVGEVVLNHQFAPEMQSLYIAYAETQPAMPDGPTPVELAPAVPWITSTIIVVLGLLLLAFYLTLMWQSRRKDIRDFLIPG